MSLFRQYLSLVGSEENITEPPEQVLDLAVIGGLAHLSVLNVNEATLLVEGDMLYTFALPARSLLRYLQAAIDEDEDENVSSVLAEMNDFTRSRLSNVRNESRSDGEQA